MDSTNMMDYNSTSDAASNGGSGVGSLVFLAIVVIIVVISIISKWILYRKAKKPGWAAIVPYYDTIVMMEVIGRPLWWFAIIQFVPFASIWFSVVTTLDFAKSYGKSTGFGILMIFLPFIGYPILAFDKNTHYNGPIAEGLSGFTPAADHGPTPGSPTNIVTQPAFVPAAADTPTMPFGPTEPASAAPSPFSGPATPAVPVVPVMPVQAPANEPATPLQPSVEQQVTPVVPPIAPVTPEPFVTPTLPEPHDTPEVSPTPSSETQQPTPPQA